MQKLLRRTEGPLLSKRTLQVCGLAITFLTVSVSPAHAADVRDAWNAVLRNCAVNGTISKTGIFFGISNTIGAGSVWRSLEHGGYGLRFELSDAFPDAQTRQKLLKTNNEID